jgi:preprotein translocase subunit Sec61beta
MSAKKSSGLKYFSEESAGFRIQPKTVLIMSLIYIGLVVLLHIWAKVAAPAKVVIPDSPTPEPAPSAPADEAAPEAEPTVD